MSGPHVAVREDRSAPNIESGVVVSSDRLWGFEYVEGEHRILGTNVVGDGSVPLVYKFLDGAEELKDVVRSTVHKDKRPSPDFETWEDYANIRFIETQSEYAPIRITFKPQIPKDGKQEDFGYWSMIGRDAFDRADFDKPSMCLSGLLSWKTKKRYGFFGPDVSLEMHRGSILHEFGHCIGLHHEHQGPAARYEFELNRNEVLKDARYCDEAKHAFAEYNIIRKVEMKDIMNYTRFDKDSIMIYDIPEKWRVGYRGKIVQKFKLSKLDKAFIQLIYPPNLGGQGAKDGEAEKKFRQAVVDAGVPPNDAGEIFSAYGGDNRTLAERLTSVRDCFNRLKEGAWALWNSQKNAAIAQAINPASLTQFGVNGFIGNVAENRLFQSVVKNVVHRTMEQHGILMKVSLPGNTQHQTTRMFAAFAAQDEFGRHVDQYVSQLVDKSASPHTSRPQDDNSVVEPPSAQPEPKPQYRTPFDLHDSTIDWAQNTKGLPHATAHVTKAGQENTVTIRVDPDDEQATLRSAENSSNFSRQAVDVDGVLYYEHTDKIKSGTTATWSSRGIVFHKDGGGFTACFLPSPFLASPSPLLDEKKLFENVEWTGL